MSTICAVSTPLAQGGISVIRISGKDALKVAKAVFRPLSCGDVSSMAGYSCAYGQIVDGHKAVDDGVLTVFRAPRSYTGEDVCEISCHGGIYVTKRVLRLCLENGAEPADRGEFTKRAFLNGKMSLTQAEAVMDTISAQGEYALNSANLARSGKLFEQIKALTDKLVDILGELAAWVDYPEEDLPAVEQTALEKSLDGGVRSLDRILENYDRGLIFKNGIDTCIAGKPNVGKSAMMNMLLGFERSIVTDVAGTTRDVVQESVRLGRVILKLSDTAGIHETADKVEKLGVELARKRLDSAMLILAGSRIIEKAYPFDHDVEDVPPRYHALQCEIASYLISRSDSQGETRHNENGVDITWASDSVPDSMLANVTPFARAWGVKE